MVRKNYSKEIEIICLGSNELIKILKDDKSAGLVKYFFGEIDLSNNWFEDCYKKPWC